MRKCKCGCLAELPPASRCMDIVSKKGYGSIECLVKHTRDKQKAKTEKEIKSRNNKLKSKVTSERTAKSRALEAAQALARVSRADDEGHCTCVTCGHIGKWNNGFDGGHFIAKGNCSYWMLDPRNIWPQCKACNGNGMKHGNKESDYTLFMIDEFGREFVDYMKSMEKTIIKRSSSDYEEFIHNTNKEISIHKKRIR